MILSSILADDKPKSFITTIGLTVSNSKIRAYNTAYINGMKVISVKISKQGDYWVTIAKVTSKY